MHLLTTVPTLSISALPIAPLKLLGRSTEDYFSSQFICVLMRKSEGNKKDCEKSSIST